MQFSGVNSFLSILNNQHVTDAIDKINTRGKATSISCFDFSTLYTKIPYDKLLKVLNELIDLREGMGNSYMLMVKGLYGQKTEGQDL